MRIPAQEPCSFISGQGGTERSSDESCCGVLNSVSPAESLSSSVVDTINTSTTSSNVPQHLIKYFGEIPSLLQSKISLERDLPLETAAEMGQCMSSSGDLSPTLTQNNTDKCEGASHDVVSQIVHIPRPTRESVLRRLSEALMRKSLTMIDLSQRGLEPYDARLVKLALLQNASLAVLKLGYNNLCDEGVASLASGIATHCSLASLDLGFNNVGDQGCIALASAISSTHGSLRTLYLSGNSITDSGARALADIMRCGCGLRRLHLTGNCIGPDGARVLLESIVDDELRRKNREMDGCDSPFSFADDNFMEELYLGGTNMGYEGCSAVAKFLQCSHHLRVISLSNCNINDEHAKFISAGIAENREHLPLNSLHLSFNRISCKGIEQLMNALWGSRTLKELKIDNNMIGDRGANLVSVILSTVKSLVTLDLGFNSITAVGMRTLMKAVAESAHLKSLSISGNNIDSGSAKAVAYALAYNRSLEALFLDHCGIGSEGQRHITAGMVSNSRTSLQILTGFQIGERAYSLGLPKALATWTNEQVLKFILLMWERMRHEQQLNNYEKEIDPLHLLSTVEGGPSTQIFSGPLDPATVVAVAQRAYDTLAETGDDLLSRLPVRPREPSFESPLSEDAIMLEADFQVIDEMNIDSKYDAVLSQNSLLRVTPSLYSTNVPGTSTNNRVIIENPSVNLNATDRKKRIVQWLCHNIHHLNELSQLPFNSSELWRLHQHFFTPCFNDSGLLCTTIPESPETAGSDSNFSGHIGGSSVVSEPFETSSPRNDSSKSIRASAPVMNQTMGSLPLLKRKVSYRFLHESCLTSETASSLLPRATDHSISKLIEDMNVQSMQPKSKKARKNRSRISFVSRIKLKLDSYLDSCHQKALVLMRQLFFVEKCLINGDIYPIESGSTTHLYGIFADDAEMILLEMM